MNAKRVCYRFNIRASITKRNGRTYHNHHFSQLGFSYEDAATSAFFELRQKKAKLLRIHEASVTGIAFAYDHDLDFFDANLKDYPVTIPTDLNAVLGKYDPEIFRS